MTAAPHRNPPGRPARAMRARCGAVACALLLAACTPARSPAPAVTPTPSLPAAAPAPADPYTELLQGRAAGPVLRIGDALIAVTVRRGGALARLGHDHVVAARRIEGYVAPAAGRAVLRFALAEMTVDEAELRREAGLATQPSADAIAGTRTNMLTKVLDAERHPDVLVKIQRAGAPGEVEADITLHGVTRRVTVPTTIETTPQGLLARGTLTLKQSDFGIVPFAVLGGALAVRDEMELRFAIAAHRVPDAVR